MSKSRRDADAIVRSRIPSIRSYDVDNRFESPTESEPTTIYTTISSATTTTISKTWPSEFKTITIANTSDTVVAKVDIYIYDPTGAATLGYIIKNMKLALGTTLVLTPEDMYVPDGDEIKIVSAPWTSGTPALSVMINI